MQVSMLGARLLLQVKIIVPTTGRNTPCALQLKSKRTQLRVLKAVERRSEE